MKAFVDAPLHPLPLNLRSLATSDKNGIHPLKEDEEETQKQRFTDIQTKRLNNTTSALNNNVLDNIKTSSSDVIEVTNTRALRPAAATVDWFALGKNRFPRAFAALFPAEDNEHGGRDRHYKKQSSRTKTKKKKKTLSSESEEGEDDSSHESKSTTTTSDNSHDEDDDEDDAIVVSRHGCTTEVRMYGGQVILLTVNPFEALWRRRLTITRLIDEERQQAAIERRGTLLSEKVSKLQALDTQRKAKKQLAVERKSMKIEDEA